MALPTSVKYISLYYALTKNVLYIFHTFPSHVKCNWINFCFSAGYQWEYPFRTHASNCCITLFIQNAALKRYRTAISAESRWWWRLECRGQQFAGYFYLPHNAVKLLRKIQFNVKFYTLNLQHKQQEQEK